MNTSILQLILLSVLFDCGYIMTATSYFPLLCSILTLESRKVNTILRLSKFVLTRQKSSPNKPMEGPETECGGEMFPILKDLCSYVC